MGSIRLSQQVFFFLFFLQSEKIISNRQSFVLKILRPIKILIFIVRVK